MQNQAWLDNFFPLFSNWAILILPCRHRVCWSVVNSGVSWLWGSFFGRSKLVRATLSNRCPKKDSPPVSSYLYVKQVESELVLNFSFGHTVQKCSSIVLTKSKKTQKKLMLIAKLTNIGHHLENKVFQKFELSVMSIKKKK